MLSFNVVDLLAVLLIISAIIVGVKHGGLRIFLFVSSFLAALWTTSQVTPMVIANVDTDLLMLILLNIGLPVAIIASLHSLKLSKILYNKISHPLLHIFNKFFGAALWSIAIIVFISFSVLSLNDMPLARISNATSSSFLYKTISHHLNNSPKVYASFDNYPAYGNEPYISSSKGLDSDKSYISESFTSAVDNSKNSIVRITGFGCGGVVSGSGFVIGDGIIMTSAHVVAGIDMPIVKFEGHSWEARVVSFNPNLDIALLELRGNHTDFNLPALGLDAYNLENHKTIALMGFAGTRYTASPGLISGNDFLEGKNIYDSAKVYTDAYLLKGEVSEGMSGGPIVAPDGRVVGVIFAKSGIDDRYAYAVKSSAVTEYLNNMKNSENIVMADKCIAYK